MTDQLAEPKALLAQVIEDLAAERDQATLARVAAEVERDRAIELLESVTGRKWN